MIGLLMRPVSWRFYIQVDGIIYGEFTECTGLEATLQTTPFYQGGSPSPVYLPGQVSESNIVLKRGIISASLWNWFEEGNRDALPGHRNLMIFLASADGIPIYWWDVTGVYPTKWTGPTLAADSSSLALESLELARGSASAKSIGGSSAASSETAKEQTQELDLNALSVMQVDRIAEQVVGLMKRDLLFERERSGLA
jgi:phage tail-like protein